jgi:hypothetical protein
MTGPGAGSCHSPALAVTIPSRGKATCVCVCGGVSSGRGAQGWNIPEQTVGGLWVGVVAPGGSSAVTGVGPQEVISLDWLGLDFWGQIHLGSNLKSLPPVAWDLGEVPHPP